MKREDLTPRQREVVFAKERVVLVFGGPGTGKTTTALWAAREELDRPDATPWQRVLFLTFSRTAVGQIARRASGVFSDKRARIEISTFHSFAWRLVRAFGCYTGRGKTVPGLQSEARAKLLGLDETRMVYDDLVPTALALLRSQRIRKLTVQRWPLIICDEFQDTSTDQWQLLMTLGTDSRLLLLGDVNQMIYTFLKAKGVGPERLKEAQRIAERVIELGTLSHRDPSGIIPAMAEAVRQRDFEHKDVTRAVRSGKLHVFVDVEEESLTEVIVSQITRVRAQGIRNIGIFAHSNEGVATLSASLAERGLDHVLVGIPEAHAEALAALTTLCAWGVSLATDQEVRIDLATFLTACKRGQVPDLATSLVRRLPIPYTIEQRLRALKQSLQAAAGGTLTNLINVACQGWDAIGITSGSPPWKRACSDFAVLARRLADLPASENSVRQLQIIMGRRRPSALVEFDSTRVGPIQIMNFHQTKGREAEAVFLIYRPGDYLADRNDDEPYEESSRVLFVSLTRAQQQVVVLLPTEPHPLVAPFAVWGKPAS